MLIRWERLRDVLPTRSPPAPLPSVSVCVLPSWNPRPARALLCNPSNFSRAFSTSVGGPLPRSRAACVFSGWSEMLFGGWLEPRCHKSGNKCLRYSRGSASVRDTLEPGNLSTGWDFVGSFKCVFCHAGSVAPSRSCVSVARWALLTSQSHLRGTPATVRQCP